MKAIGFPLAVMADPDAAMLHDLSSTTEAPFRQSKPW